MKITGETSLSRIMRKTGRKISQCKCSLCKKQCRTPCLGTPEDIERIIDAGYKSHLAVTYWGAGIVLGVIDRPILMVQIKDKDNSGCSFFKNGLCELHDKGLKPTEGKLSHHTLSLDNFNPKKSIAWHVAKEWLDEDNADIIYRITQKLLDGDDKDD